MRGTYKSCIKLTAYALFVGGTLLIYEGIREHAKRIFYIKTNISKISLLN